MTILPCDYFSSIHTCHPTFHFLKSFKNLLLLKREPENERVINRIIWLTFRRPNQWLIDEMATGLSRRSTSIIWLLLPMVLTNQLGHWPSLLLCNNFKAKTYDQFHYKPPFCDTLCNDKGTVQVLDPNIRHDCSQPLSFPVSYFPTRSKSASHWGPAGGYMDGSPRCTTNLSRNLSLLPLSRV